MKKLIFICSLINLTACSGLDYWVNGFVEKTSTGLASVVSELNFTRYQQEDLYYFLDEVLRSRNCNEVLDYMDDNNTLLDLKLNYNLGNDFLFEGLLNISNFTQLITNLGTNLNLNPLKATTAAIVTSWKKDYTIDEINEGINYIKYCDPLYSQN